MRIVDIISKKRDGYELTAAEIERFISAYTSGEAPDYQAAAMLMAIYLQGMSRRETVELTMAMIQSGDQLDLHDVVDFAIDKHSSGGVGDKTSLVVLPLVAAAGVPVAKMSGRGLGFSGGTLDKAEAISGWSSQLSMVQFREQVNEIGLALAGQTADLAPADGKLYALRDVTATVSSIPLIAASIMSKKLAAGADGIVLDVKVGSGAFMTTLEEATTLAETMVKIGVDAGRRTIAILSDMNQPLGHAVGNALETAEAIRALQRDPRTPPDFWAHCVEIASHMLVIAGAMADIESAKIAVIEARDNGAALQKFRQMIVAQGGDGDQVDDPDKLPQAPVKIDVLAPADGYVQAMDTGAIGWICVDLGGGRAKKSDIIDPAVGLDIPIKVGAHLAAGERIATIHAATQAAGEKAAADLQQAVTWSSEPVNRLPHFYGIVAESSAD